MYKKRQIKKIIETHRYPNQFLQAIERIQVNQSLSEMAVSLLQDAVMATAKNKSEQNAVHALLLVNAKLFALYSRYFPLLFVP